MQSINFFQMFKFKTAVEIGLQITVCGFAKKRISEHKTFI